MGCAAHKFSSGSYTEGRLAAKGAVSYVYDNPQAPKPDDGKTAEIAKDLWAPLLRFDEHKGATTREEINPNYLLPKQALQPAPKDYG